VRDNVTLLINMIICHLWRAGWWWHKSMGSGLVFSRQK